MKANYLTRTAFSYLGHDFEVKCYLDIVNNFNIKTFYDVGANYGQHSVLIMSQGTFSFEPNQSCHKLNFNCKT